MNANEKINYEGLIGAGGSIGKTPAEVALLRSYDHNWQDDLLRKGFIQNNNFFYSGGTEQFTNYMSVGILKIQGLLTILKDLIESQQGIIVSIRRVRV
jgi:hypothetical protein